MRPSRLAWTIPSGLILLAVLPVVASGSPLSGTVTNCSTRTSCDYVFNTTKGMGWANTSGTTMSLRMPGEPLTSTNLSYATYIARLTGTYTYWTVGNFLGTDVNTGWVVLGTTDTNYTITCNGHSGRGGGCTYTYTTDNGTIVVKLTKAEQTATSLSCSRTSMSPAQKTNCTVTVTNLWNASNYPTGSVHLSSARLGTVSVANGTCPLTKGSCSFTWKPFDSTCGTVPLTAKYAGSAAFYKSSATIDLAVIVSGGC